MITTLVATLYDPAKAETFSNLLDQCRGFGSSISVEQDQTTGIVTFYIGFNSDTTANGFVSHIYTTMKYPSEEFTSLRHSDFEINTDTSVKSVNEHLVQKQIAALQNDIDVLDTVVSTLAADSDKQDKRLTGIEEYIRDSGIAHYQSFIDELLTVLEDRQIINKSETQKKMLSGNKK